jgi:DNA processing protein
MKWMSSMDVDSAPRILSFLYLPHAMIPACGAASLHTNMSHPVRQIGPAEYPAQLREIPDPPERLWARGLWPRADTRYLAVVGSRALSAYGREACRMLIGGLAGYPVSIVSGLALGADACAHQAALDAGLHTIAIPGSGLGDCALYPAANRKLARDILDADGLLLSEHEPDHAARKYDFPSRNRIMAGIAHATLVIEAGERSGTLITARLASDYNRELLCVPHRIGDAHGFAAHVFLRIGAAHVTEPLHVLEALKIAPRKEDVHGAADGANERAGFARAQSLTGAERMLYDLLAEPRARDDLIRASGLDPGGALAALVSLEMKDLVAEQFGAWRRL